MVDALVSGTSGATRGGSSPLPGTNTNQNGQPSLAVLICVAVPWAAPWPNSPRLASRPLDSRGLPPASKLRELLAHAAAQMLTNLALRAGGSAGFSDWHRYPRPGRRQSATNDGVVCQAWQPCRHQPKHAQVLDQQPRRRNPIAMFQAALCQLEPGGPNGLPIRQPDLSTGSCSADRHRCFYPLPVIAI